MRLGEAVGLVQGGVLVHPLYHPGRGHGGGDTAEAAGAMGMELEKGTGCIAAIRGVGPACSAPQGLKSPPSTPTKSCVTGGAVRSTSQVLARWSPGKMPIQ